MTVGVIFGGKSSEHRVSIATGIQVIHMIKGYKVIPIYIGEDGIWRTDARYDTIEGVNCRRYGKRVHILPGDNRLFTARGRSLTQLDAVVNCCHGMTGEDGVLQGVFRMSGIPLTGSDVLASAIGMDKIVMKRLFKEAGLPVVKFAGLDRITYESDMFPFIRQLKDDMQFPMIVKPSNLGSSIGIQIAHNVTELFEAIRVAFEWDNRIIIEEALEDFVELNCAALGRGCDVEVTELEQPVGWKEFLKYEDKYAPGKGKNPKRLMPAPVSEEIRERIRALTREAFRTIGASGVARIDFMLKGEDVYVNEINTVPGSLANYLFSYGGKLPPDKLMERLIELAIEDTRDRNRLKFAFSSPDIKGLTKS